MAPAPLVFVWTGSAFEPMPQFERACAQFAVGGQYRLEAVEERSKKTHDHFMAQVDDAWSTLPEHLAMRFPTADHLRKWCLIKAGFSNIRVETFATHDDALKVAAFVTPVDEFAVVTVLECTVYIAAAKTQKLLRNGGQMDRKDFQASKQAVFDVIGAMLGTDRSDLRRAKLVPEHEPEDERVDA